MRLVPALLHESHYNDSVQLQSSTPHHHCPSLVPVHPRGRTGVLQVQMKFSINVQKFNSIWAATELHLERDVPVGITECKPGELWSIREMEPHGTFDLDQKPEITGELITFQWKYMNEHISLWLMLPDLLFGSTLPLIFPRLTARRFHMKSSNRPLFWLATPTVALPDLQIKSSLKELKSTPEFGCNHHGSEHKPAVGRRLCKISLLGSAVQSKTQQNLLLCSICTGKLGFQFERPLVSNFQLRKSEILHLRWVPSSRWLHRKSTVSESCNNKLYIYNSVIRVSLNQSNTPYWIVYQRTCCYGVFMRKIQSNVLLPTSIPNIS